MADQAGSSIQKNYNNVLTIKKKETYTICGMLLRKLNGNINRKIKIQSDSE